MSKWIDFDFVKSKKRFDKGKMKFIVWMQDIYHAPSLDLVRCAECKKNDTRNCPFYSGGWIHSDDDFCSYGVRKESK